MTLDGLQTILANKYRRKQVNKVIYEPKVHIVRYADDFIITGTDENLLKEIKILVQEFFQERGLTLSEEKNKDNSHRQWI